MKIMSGMWNKIKQWLARFMAGRHGMDHLSVALIGAGLALWLLGSIVSSIQITLISLIGFLITLAGMGCYVFSIVRMFSRNNEKRNDENRKYCLYSERKKTEFRQAKNRFKNRKQYKYFKCPGCKAWLRLSRGTGVVTVTCRKCHTNFTQKS